MYDGEHSVLGRAPVLNVAQVRGTGGSELFGPGSSSTNVRFEHCCFQLLS